MVNRYGLPISLSKVVILRSTRKITTATSSTVIGMANRQEYVYRIKARHGYTVNVMRIFPEHWIASRQRLHCFITTLILYDPGGCGQSTAYRELVLR